MQVIEYRRALHRIPELDRDLPETLAYLRSVLEPLGCALFSPIPGALCAFFDFGKADAIAFRSDADALPIQEQTGLPFASTHPGKMHACGHDGHMSMVLDLAVWLDSQKDLNHNVLLLFQPAEETTGGAKDLCQSGVFEQYNVTCLFGLHLWPALPAGVVASRKKEMMSRSCEVSVTITGRSSHIAKAEEGLDALAAGVEFYRRAVALEKELSPDIYRLLKFGRMESGTVRNAVSGKTVLLGSLRAFVGEVRDEMARTDCRSGCLVGKLAQEVNTLPENFREQLSAVFAEWQDVFARGLKRAQETGEISPELDCASTAAFFWYGWEGALQRANLELNIKPVDIFIGNFFSRLTG